MSKSKICLIALGIVLLIAGTALLTSKPKHLSHEAFPERACSRVFLPAAGRPVVHRSEKCDQNGLPASAEVEFANGNLEQITLRADRTAKKSVEYYPGEGAPESRKVRSRAIFAADGETYLSHEVYRLDGTLERSGRGEKDGRYVINYFYADGKTPSRTRQFLNKKFHIEKRFREDGSPLANLRVEGTQVLITMFSPEGSWIANLARSPMGVTGGEVFSQDGTTLLASFIRDNWNFQEYFFDAQGKRTQVRMGAIMFGNVSVAVYDKDEKVMYIQVFRKRPKRGALPEELILSRISEYGEGQKIARIIQMNNEGTRPFSIIEPAGDGRVVSDLNDSDGRVLKRTHYDRSGAIVKTETGRRFKSPRIEAARLKDIPHIELPTYTDTDAPPYLYDYR